MPPLFGDHSDVDQVLRIDRRAPGVVPAHALHDLVEAELHERPRDDVVDVGLPAAARHVYVMVVVVVDLDGMRAFRRVEILDGVAQCVEFQGLVCDDEQTGTLVVSQLELPHVRAVAVLLRTDVREIHLLGRRPVEAERRAALAVPVVLLRTASQVGHVVEGGRQAQAQAEAWHVEFLGVVAGAFHLLYPLHVQVERFDLPFPLLGILVRVVFHAGAVQHTGRNERIDHLREHRIHFQGAVSAEEVADNT